MVKLLLLCMKLPLTIDCSIDHLSSFGSDGANVMTGRHGGVATLLKSMNSYIIYLCITSVIGLLWLVGTKVLTLGAVGMFVTVLRAI